MGLIYYLPAGRKVKDFVAERFGEGVPHGKSSVDGGPGNEPGELVGVGLKIGRLRYEPDLQRWEQPDGCEWWIGCYAEHPPGPDDLARKRQLRGHPVQLGDGREWLVPVVYLAGGPTPETRLPPPATPQNMELLADDTVVYTPQPGYEDLLEGTATFWRWFMGQKIEETDDEPEALSQAAMLKLAIDALNRNYLVHREEVNFLRLVRTELLVDVGKAMIDWPVLEQVAKEMAQASAKKDSGEPASAEDSSTADTSSGEQAGSPAPQPLPTSS